MQAAEYDSPDAVRCLIEAGANKETATRVRRPSFASHFVKQNPFLSVNACLAYEFFYLVGW
jgi:hypothetical protein